MIFIYLKAFNFIVDQSDPGKNSRRVLVNNYERSSECSLTNDSTDLNHVYECQQVSRMFIVEGDSVVTNINRKGYGKSVLKSFYNDK